MFFFSGCIDIFVLFNLIARAWAVRPQPTTNVASSKEYGYEKARSLLCLLGHGVGSDVVDDLGGGRELLRLVVRDLNSKFFLHGHDDLHDVE